MQWAYAYVIRRFVVAILKRQVYHHGHHPCYYPFTICVFTRQKEYFFEDTWNSLKFNPWTSVIGLVMHEYARELPSFEIAKRKPPLH